MKCENRTFSLAKSFLHYLALTLLAVGATAQSNHRVSQGATPANLAPGSPDGSYAVSGFETVDPFSGKVNFSFPLFTVGGRGTAGYPVRLNIQRNWHIAHDVFDPNFYGTQAAERYAVTHTYTPKDDDSALSTYGIGAFPGFMGVMKGTRMGINQNVRVCGDQPCYDKTRTDLTFVGADGTEIPFRDLLLGGATFQFLDAALQKSRGTTWVSTNGSGAIFVSNAVIHDYRIKSAVGDGVFFPSGTLRLADGSKYIIENGWVVQIIDRNGNRVQPGIDSLGREIIKTEISDPEPNVVRQTQFDLKGIGGVSRFLRINYSFLETRLSPGFALLDLWGLFPALPRPEGMPDLPYNPQVPSSIELPDGARYEFKYNKYGELAEVTLPTGAKYEYVWQESPGLYGDPEDGEVVPPLDSPPLDDAPNLKVYRRVEKRRVYEGGVLRNETVYSPPAVLPNQKSMVTVDSYSNNGGSLILESRSKHYYSGSPVPDPIYRPNAISQENWMYGRELSTEVFGSDGVTMLRRSLNGWRQTPLAWAAGNPDTAPANDSRLEKTISIHMENGKALVSYSSTSYDEIGSADPEFFSHLNAKAKKSYHYKTLDINTARTADLATIVSMFGDNDLASISETDYSYDPNYKARGIIGLPTETRVLNQSNPSEVLAKTQYVYDEAAHFDDSYTTTNWEDPNSNLRGNVTTTRTWNKDTDTWLESHTMYDNFGNVRKVWDASGDVNKFVETQYDPAYKYAYPTKVIAPAPDPSNTTGTNQTSTVETTYDFTTGLPLSVKDDFGQITKTEYDAFLRPIRVYADNFTAPESQTIYGVPDSNGQYPPSERFVKVRKQIDGTNWDEAITWTDGLGRTIKTQAKDSQGDVFVETVYDALGRVERMTNPFRQGDTVYWSKTRYDEMSRAVESYAPTVLANLANAESLGVTSFDISTVSGFVGTVVTTTDASGRKGRSITNALGQLLRVDEPMAIGGSETNDLGSLATPSQPTFYKYDLYGKMVEVTQGVQKRWFKYDSLGRLIRVRQPEQEVNTALNLADSFNTSGQWTAGFTYDVLGNVLTATDANGVTITNTYDRAGRVKTRSYSDSTPAVSFFYDGKGLSAPQTPNYAKGKLTKVTSSVSATEYQLFDNLGRMTQMAQITDGHTYASKYTYNFAGALVEEEYPSGRKVKSDFESDGDLLKVTSQKNASAAYMPYASSFSYTASGGISQMKLGNGRWETAKFNTRLQVEELGLGSSATNAGLWKTAYEYGELQTNGSVDTAKNTGNIAKQTLSVPGASFTQSYKYDSLYRLTEATETTGSTQNWTQSWNYDRYGNRVGFAQNVAGFTDAPNPAVDTNTNRFSSGQGFSYDLNGNLIVDNQGRQFTFNGDNKQTVVRDAANNVIGQYFFDGEGKRVKKITNSETTVFVYSSGKLIAEYSNQVSQTPTVAYMTTDHLGSPRIITNQFGQVKSRRDFMPFGEDLFEGVGTRTHALTYSANTDDIKQKFTGYLKDKETGLDFAEARMYENRFGRFTAVDPLLASGKSGNPQTFNRYAYTSNNPVIRVDVDGKDWVKIKHVRVTYGRTYVTWQPVWKDNAVGSERWEKGVFRIQTGKDRGKWAALDPYNDRWHLAGTRADAVAAYESYKSQMQVDVTAGAVQPAVEAINGAEMLATRGASLGSGDRGLGTKIRDTLFGAFGKTPDESSGPFRSASNLSSVLTTTGGSIGGFANGGSLTLTNIRAPLFPTKVPSRLASSTDAVETGSYLLRFESGKFYAGKGPESRMNRSASDLFRTHNDPVVGRDFFPASSNRDAFIHEHKLMMENGGPLSFDPLSPTYNKIHSPGCRFFC